jgi:transketolase
MLQYSLLHLTGYKVGIDDLKNFRQFNSITPGHPEYGYTVGVETTTGPLGQGLANAVGFALAEKQLAKKYNREHYDIINHYTYVFAGDGCLMEGVSHEVCALAGTWELGKLIVFYDDNGISIDGEVEGWFNENVHRRFESYHWQVIGPIDGHNIEEINLAIKKAKAVHNKPTLIICKTIIGKGSPNKSGKEECHGSPLGATELELVRKELNWNYAPFEIPSQVYKDFDCKGVGLKAENKWNQLFMEYQSRHPELATELLRCANHELPKDWDKILVDGIHLVNDKEETIATRKASQNAIEYFA